MNHQVNNWTGCYWVLILNQLLVLGPIVVLAAALLHQAWAVSVHESGAVRQPLVDWRN